MVTGNRYSAIGIDLGCSSVKMAQIRSGGKSKPHLQAVAKERYGTPTQDDARVEHGEAVAASIRRMLKNKAFRGRKAATVLPRADVFIRPVKLSGKLDPEDTESVWEALQTEARRYLPYPPEDAVLDFVMIGKVQDDEGEHLEVLLLSAPKEKVDRHVALLRDAGLDCAFIDIVPNAVLRSARIAHTEEGQDATAGIEIGNIITTISVLQPDRLLFARDVNIGGNTFTAAIAENLGLTVSKAERFKRRYGMDHRAGSGLDLRLMVDAKLRPEETSALIFELCQGPLRALAKEIKRSLDYFAAQFRGIKVSTALLFGGGANFKGLSGFLGENTGLTVQTGEPFAAVQTNGTVAIPEDKASFAVALGLALREE